MEELKLAAGALHLEGEEVAHNTHLSCTRTHVCVCFDCACATPRRWLYEERCALVVLSCSQSVVPEWKVRHRQREHVTTSSSLGRDPDTHAGGWVAQPWASCTRSRGTRRALQQHERASTRALELTTGCVFNLSGRSCCLLFLGTARCTSRVDEFPFSTAALCPHYETTSASNHACA